MTRQIKRSERIEARQAIVEVQMVRLTAADQKKLLVEALRDPPEPALAMRRAFAHHRRLVRAP